MVNEEKPGYSVSRRVVRPRNIPARHFDDTDEKDLPKQAKIIPTDRPVHSKHRVWWKRMAVGLAAFLVIGLVVFGLKAVMAGQKVITRNANPGAPALAGDFDPTKLKGEGEGRINVLLLGIGGPGHDGPLLSDTIMVASIDPRTKDVALLSIPRDFYVKIPGFGSTKINAATAYGETPKNPGGGAALAKETISKILDIPIHYYVRVDFSAFKQSVDTVGGVDIDVKKAIYDPEYPCEKSKTYCPFKIAFGRQHMNGSLALQFARSRKGTGGGDFDRAARQQQILAAVQEKALSLSILANPVKVFGLMDVVGNHIATDLQPAEIKKMLELVKDFDMSKATNKVLDTSPEGLLQFGNIPGAGSIVVPKAGLYDYTEIRELVHSIFVDNYLKDEAAKLEIQNGTSKDGLGNAVAKLLKSYNYNIVAVTTASNQDAKATIIYDYTGGKKPFTTHYLEKRFGVKAQPAGRPGGTDSSVDLSVIVGNDYRISP